ncbi:MAG TPA: hypothetical protein VML54_13940 [Candidatus Limnocylindrales bacterium]|nr:hypothetical protein [Candidatus Limnocylindrales bacterium]
MKPILAGSGFLLAYLGWRSLAWPLIHDAPLMHYIAWLIGQGAVPYRDAFDMNFPGVYAVHAAVLAALGGGDLAWRLFDLGWLLVTALIVAAYCGRFAGGASAAAGALLFALYHVAGGAARVGQRDFLLCAFLIAGAWGVARSWERAGALGPLASAGLVLGAGLTIKPHAILFWLGAAAVAGVGRRRAGRAWVTGAGAVLLAGLVAPAVACLWLAWRGGLGAFGSVLADYVIPLYTRVGRVAVWEAFGGHAYGWPIFALLGALGVLGLVWGAGRSTDIRFGLGLLGVGYGVAHYAAQGKGWAYHLYPLALFLCVLAASAAGIGAGQAPRRAWAGLQRAVMLLVLAGTVAVLGAKGVDAREVSWVAAKSRLVTTLAGDLRALVPPGGTVQVMDTTSGGIHALLRLGVRPPTRFIYDFHFFHDEQDPRIQALRAEFVRGLEAAPPAALVVLRRSWPELGYERLARFPALARLLADRYEVARDGGDYRIYAKRSGS